MAITILLQKNRASSVPQFNFDKPFLDEKSDFEIANFQFLRKRAVFWILTIYIKEKTPVKGNIENIL